MNSWTKLQKDPFRLFFPLGAALALAGVAPWASQYFTHASYPRDLHRMLMINGFLLSFVCGFLMTAVPRFTASFQATGLEITAIACFLFAAAVSAFQQSPMLNSLFSTFAVLTLISFAARRFLNKKSNPPYTFVFIGVGLLLWLLASVSMLIQNFATLPASVSFIADDVFSNGAIMSLILGVGGRLIPGILGWQEIVTLQRQRYETPRSYLRLIPVSIWLAVILFLLSFFLTPIVPLQLCFWVRFAVTLYFAIRYWKLYRVPATRSFLTWSIWLSAWSLVLGYLLPAIWVQAYVHALHLLFVGGFSLLTLIIAMRVTFAHGPTGTAVEKTTPAILVVSFLIAFAALTRVTAIIWSKIYLDHLGYAAMTWILALGLWVFTLFRPTSKVS